jgi:hypothetical protein
MDRKFPALLGRAIIKGSKLYFRQDEITDEELIEYLSWKGFHGLEVVRPSHLMRFYRQGAYKEEIRALFKKNNKIAVLLQSFDRKRKSA